ncbi:MAG: glycosyl hydrolase, partial [Clostridium perfringens]|nr:glycosyl hydrolase [Clostridium perfringens]
MNRKGVLRFMFVFMLLLLLPFTISKAKDFPANPIEKAGYKLDFSDEFNGPTLD